VNRRLEDESRCPDRILQAGKAGSRKQGTPKSRLTASAQHAFQYRPNLKRNEKKVNLSFVIFVLSKGHPMGKRIGQMLEKKTRKSSKKTLIGNEREDVHNR
jgi:hypothetical protein